MLKIVSLVSLLLLLALVIPARGEVAGALIMEGDVLPGAPAGHAITSISNTAVNHSGGSAVTVNTSDGTTTLSHAWGSSAGGPGSVIRTEGTFGNFQQNSWEGFFGFSNAGVVGYSPTSTDTSSGTTGLDGVWLDDNVIMIEEAVYPNMPGMFWTFGSRVGVTAAGAPYWVGGFSSVQGGSTQNRGLYFGPGATPILVGGGVVAGLPDTLSHSNTVSFDCRYNAAGTSYIAEAATQTGSTLNDNHMVIDGSVIFLNGLAVSENGPVPPAIGGLAGELWDNFDFVGIGAGGWMFTGDTGAGTAVDEIIVVNGIIEYREGDTIETEILSGAIEGAYMNDDGDLAFIWDIQAGTIEALFMNGRLLLKEGDEVDINGDGNIDVGTALTNFTGISTLTISDRDGSGNVDVYFTADVDVPVAMSDPGRIAIAVEASADSDREALGLEAAGTDEEGVSKNAGRAVLEGYFVISVPADATGVAGSSIGEEGSAARHGLLSVSPNPAHAGETQVRFIVPGNLPVELNVFDVAGRRVRSLASGSYPVGERTVQWDGRDGNGKPAAAGIYFLKYSAGETVETRKVTIVR